MPSSDANRDAAAGPAPATLLATAGFLAERGLYGVVWLDADLVVVERYGHLVESIALGSRLAESMIAFLGFDEAIQELKAAPQRTVALPNVMLDAVHGQSERVSLAVYWMEHLGRFLLLVARAVSRADLEQALAAQVRGRAIAEAEVAAQARLIRRANHELANANQDLGEFASVISHDLGAPLRGMRYAAEAAKAALGGGPAAAEAVAHLDELLGLARRMRGMLTGLLDYARAGRKADRAETIDMRALAAEVAQSVNAGGDTTIDVQGEWPTIVTVAEPLDMVLRNLVDNAIKHHDRRTGRVVIEARDEGAFVAISVSDDGPGIAPEWQEAIFLPFRQIGDADNSDGVGIGLALVKKTVERFGGSIELHSAPAERRGSSFRFTWPKALPS